MVVSLYLDVNDDMGEINMGMLYEVGDWIMQMGLPYVICGDFNNNPSEIAATHWITAIDGVVVAPEQPTHWAASQDEGSKIDFFVVKAWLAPYTTATTQSKKPTPHIPVVLTIDYNCVGLYEHNVKKPTAFPTETTSGVTNQDAAEPN